ncbi:hypothetical protein ACWDKQ_21320 [Saccharopolyspora sp. NPDC000995]
MRSAAATSESVSRTSAAPIDPLPGTQSAHRALLLRQLLGSEGGGTDRGVGLGELLHREAHVIQCRLLEAANGERTSRR